MILSEIRKERVKNECIKGAQKYNRLIGKHFEITIENGEAYIVQFNKEDFQHLTGVNSTFTNRAFFTNCLNATITCQNITDYQSKDWNTIKSKLKIIVDIDKLIYGNINDVLLLDVLHTPTCDFPIALRNDVKDATVAFIDRNLHARSLRKARHSLEVDNTYRIVKIREKMKTESDYTKVIYSK